MKNIQQIEYIESQKELLTNHSALLESTRGQVKLYMHKLISMHSWDIDKDIRINILHQIDGILIPHVMNLLFNIQQVVNHSFQIQHFKTDTFKDADRIYHAYIKFNKNGLIYNLSAIVERYLRIIAKELDSTIDISKGIFDIRKKIFEIVCISKTGNEWNALNLLTAIRNTIHNNGIYVNPSLTKLDDSFSYRNSIYSFVNNTPHNYATYENLNDIINDILSLVKIINNNQVIVTKESFIDDCIYL